VVRGARIHPRQQAQPQRHRRTNDRFGLIASGKAYNDTRQALHDLGLDEDTCRRIGIRLHKVNVVWPLEATITRDFAQGLQEILVVEEKRQVIEYQVKEELYNWRPDVRPTVLGKFDDSEADGSGGEWSHANPSQNWLLRAQADLTPAIIAKAIAKRLKKLGVDADTAARMDSRVAIIEAKERSLQVMEVKGSETSPAGAVGRPHPVVLQRLPAQHLDEGARRLARRGRHRLPLHGGVDGSFDSTFTQMGGEGVPWVGQAPFTTGPAHLREPG